MSLYKDLLDKYYKDELHEIADSLGVQGIKFSTKKSTMIEAITDYVINTPEKWLYQLTESDLDMLKKAIDAGREKLVPWAYNPLPTALEHIDVVEVKYNKEMGECYTIVPDVYDAICGKVDKVIADKSMDGSFKLDRLALSILNIYGMIPVKQFLDAINELRIQAGCDEAILNMMPNSSLVMASRVIHKNQAYMATPYMTRPEMIMKLRTSHPSPTGTRYAKLDVVRALEVSELMPFGTYGVKSDEGQAVLDMLHLLGYTEEECMSELHDIWLNAQYPMLEKSTSMLFAAVEDVVDAVGKFEQYESFVKIIADYANSVPKWILRGFSANETGVLKVDIKVEESPREGADISTGIPDYMNKNLPQPEKTTDVSKYGISIKRVGMNDPCPCGSGLTYGRCHGKNVN